MKLPNATPTESEIAAKMAEHFMDASEREYAIEYVLEGKIRAMKAEFERLSTFDLSEFKDLVDSAQRNAIQTCKEESIADFDGFRFWEMAVGTLECSLDAAGIGTRENQPPETVSAAVDAVKVAGDALRNAQSSLLSACAALQGFAPHKPGDNVTHGRYGDCIVSHVTAKPHPEYGALWEITARPHRKDGKPGMRETTWSQKIITA